MRGNFWPTARFTDLADLNNQARVWVETVANVRVHGTTWERPADRLIQERSHLLALPRTERVEPYLREERKVGRDGVSVNSEWVSETRPTHLDCW